MIQPVENTHVLEKLPLGMSCRVRVCKLNVNESKILYTQKEEEDFYSSMYEATLLSSKVIHILCDETMETMEKWLNMWVHERIGN